VRPATRTVPVSASGTDSRPKRSLRRFLSARKSKTLRPATGSGRLLTRRTIFTASIMVVGGLAAGTASWLAYDHIHNKKTVVAVKAAETVSEKPSFKPVVPDGKQNLATPTAGKSTYVPDKQVFTFYDSLQGDVLVVSEQPVPAQFQSDPNSLKSVAQTIGATETFETKFGTAYVATSQNHSSQRVVLIRQSLLVFLESVKVYDNTTWKNYIESLQ